MYQTINGWTKSKMIEHIKTNFKGKSRNDVNCLYRGPEGKKCAVGLFIPDEKYSDKMDNTNSNSATSIIKDFNLIGVMPLESVAMNDLQITHDNSDESITLNTMLTWINENVED